MRLTFSGDEILLSQLTFLQNTFGETEMPSKGTIVRESIQLLYQVDVLLAAGCKLAVIDPEGNKHFISKRGTIGDDDEGRQDERENREGPETE